MSLTTMSTTRWPVSGRVHSFSSLGLPPAVCSISTITFFTPATRSMAPPMPFTILPGIIQLARSPLAATCSAPRMDRSMCPPRIIAKESALEKMLVVGSIVTVCLPALMMSGSSSPSMGKGPMPSMPFSLCSCTDTPSGMWFATSVGMPMPRLT